MKEPEIYRQNPFKVIPLVLFNIAMGCLLFISDSYLDPEVWWLILCSKLLGLILIIYCVILIYKMPFTYVSLDDNKIVFVSKSKKIEVPWDRIEEIDCSGIVYSRSPFRFIKITIPTIRIDYLTINCSQIHTIDEDHEDYSDYMKSLHIGWAFKKYKILQERILELYTKYKN